MHELRRFVQAELDARGWPPGKLARLARMHRQTISKIVNDDRAHLGQMPDDSTLEGIARGFSIPVERVRVAAARSLVGYEDDGTPLTADLSELPLDALFGEIRRRIESVGDVADKPERDGLARLAVHQEAAKSMRRNRRVQNPDDTHQEGG